MTVAKLDKRVGDLKPGPGSLVEGMEVVAARYLDAIVPWVAGQFAGRRGRRRGRRARR